MARSDSTGAKVAVAVALTAALLSPRMRGVLRRGAVQGLAGVLTAGDALTSFARGVSRGMQEPSAPPANPPVDPGGLVAPAAPSTPAAGDVMAGDGAADAPPPRRRRRAVKPRTTPAARSAAASAPAAPASEPGERTGE